MRKITKVAQLVVTAPDRPGMLAELSGVLARAGVNIDAFCAYSVGKTAIFYLICNNNKKAKLALTAEGWKVKEEEVVAVALENTKGALSKLAEKLKVNNINLVYCYGSTSNTSCACLFVFKAVNNNKAIAALKKRDSVL